MNEVRRRPQNRPCIVCGQQKEPESFYWCAYTTTQGKPSMRRESRCIECVQQRRRSRYAAAPVKNQVWSNRWKTLNKERMLAKQAEYKKTLVGKAVCNASNAKRKAALLQRLPVWADLNAIETFYDEAAAVGLTVDHEIPLQGKRVSGLHVSNNLRLLSKSENSSKKNHFAVL